MRSRSWRATPLSRASFRLGVIEDDRANWRRLPVRPGWLAGQVIDLLGEGRAMNLEQLEYLHGKKTGALFLAAVRGGARLGGAHSRNRSAALREYARALGLAFQVVDDLLDVEAIDRADGQAHTTRIEARGKNTYPVLIGIERSATLARELAMARAYARSSFDHRAEPLRAIADFVVERKL